MKRFSVFMSVLILVPNFGFASDSLPSFTGEENQEDEVAALEDKTAVEMAKVSSMNQLSGLEVNRRVDRKKIAMPELRRLIYQARDNAVEAMKKKMGTIAYEDEAKMLDLAMDEAGIKDPYVRCEMTRYESYGGARKHVCDLKGQWKYCIYWDSHGGERPEMNTATCDEYYGLDWDDYAYLAKNGPIKFDKLKAHREGKKFTGDDYRGYSESGRLPEHVMKELDPVEGATPAPAAVEPVAAEGELK